MEQWNIIKAHDYCYNVTDGTHDSPKQTEFGKYLITSKHIKDNRIDFESAYKISEDDYNKIITRSKVDQWDIIISMIGAYCGFCCIESSKQTDYAIKNVGLLKVGNEFKCKWLYYYLTSPHGKQQLSKLRSGSSQPYISLGALRNLDIPVPNENTMSDIVSVLSSLDSKIELNRRINDNLEQQAQALFKSWFVDFEPFKNGEFVDSELGMIPKGWTIVSLGDITCKFGTGLNPRNNFKLGEGSNFYVTIKNMNDNRIYLDNKCDRVTDEAIKIINKRSKLQKGDLLFSGIGTIGRVAMITEEPLNWNTSESIFNMHPEADYSSEFLYTLLLSSQLQSFVRIHAQGGVQQGIRMASLKSFLIALPEMSVLQDFDKLVIPIISSIRKNDKEIDNLSSIRDALLPKLMSGELKINDLNC